MISTHYTAWWRRVDAHLRACQHKPATAGEAFARFRAGDVPFKAAVAIMAGREA